MAEVLASLKKIGGSGEQYTETVLWTNPSPTADFAAQTVTLSDSIGNYKYIGIKYCYAKTNTDIVDTAIYKTEEVRTSVIDGSHIHNIILLGVENTNNYGFARIVGYVSDTSIKFTIAYRLNVASTLTNAVIPLEILGINELAHAKGFDETILWSNSNPSSNFAESNLTSLAINDYEYLKIVYKPSTTNSFQKETIIPTSSFTADNNGRYVIGGTSSSNWARMFVRMGDTDIRVADSRAYGGTLTDNSTMIPLQIIGCNFR